MNLNLPIFDQLAPCQNLLIAGMGGGFDIYCGLPIYFELKQRGMNVHLANYSFSNIKLLEYGKRLSNTLVGVQAGQDDARAYFPEKHLADWFKEKLNQEVTIWSFHKTGVVQLYEDYQRLIEHLAIDGVLLVDGGVDSLVRGDETMLGTVVEDAVSLCAVQQLKHLKARYLTCIGFGAELHMTYSHILENIAAITQDGGFKGVCALTPQMPSYLLYEQAVLYAQNQPQQEASVINSSIISSVRGHHGDFHLTSKTKGSSLYISPLMGLYWWFDLMTVAKHNHFLSQISETVTFQEALRLTERATDGIAKRKHVNIWL
jgi:hypothetical protein